MNLLHADPSRTATLRRVFLQGVAGRYNRLAREVSRRVQEMDFGLPAIEGFAGWLEVEAYKLNGPWWADLLLQAYERGVRRSYDAVRGGDVCTPAEYTGASREFVRGLCGERSFILNSSFASTQINITDPNVVAKVKEVQEVLDPADVVKLEEQPHITVRYGLHEEVDADRVAMLVESFGPVRVKLRNLSLFHTEEADVLKIDVHSPHLRTMHGRLGLLPNTETYSKYQPHLTVAYLRPGSGIKYTMLVTQLEGWEASFDQMVHSTKDREQTAISLNQLRAYKLNGPWWADLLLQAYERGVRRSYDAVRGGDVCTPAEYTGASREFVRGLCGERTVVLNYDPRQPRHPKGDPQGGQWTSTGGRIHAWAVQQFGPGRAEEFVRWFGDSKVVDKEGLPLMVYHGTTLGWETWEKEEFQELPAFFSDDMQDASSYGPVRGFYLRIEKPINVDNNDLLLTEDPNGHDGEIADEVPRLYVVYSADQVWFATPPIVVNQLRDVASRFSYTPEQVQLLAARLEEEFAGVATGMTKKVLRALIDGVQKRQHSDVVARRIRQVMGISKMEAQRLARTELVRIHAEGQLDALERLGIENVTGLVEFEVSGLGRTPKGNLSPCPQCKELDGIVLAVRKAHGVIPVHPNCLCAWKPLLTARYEKGQKRSVRTVREAIRRSRRRLA